jgi:hypothetical protein
MAVLMPDPDLQVAGGAIRSQLVHQEGQVEEDHHNPRYGGAAMSFSGSQPAGRDFVGGSRFGQPSSDTYGGMNGGQMVMGSAMGARINFTNTMDTTSRKRALSTSSNSVKIYSSQF